MLCCLCSFTGVGCLAQLSSERANVREEYGIDSPNCTGIIEIINFTSSFAYDEVIRASPICSLPIVATRVLLPRNTNKCWRTKVLIQLLLHDSFARIRLSCPRQRRYSVIVFCRKREVKFGDGVARMYCSRDSLPGYCPIYSFQIYSVFSSDYRCIFEQSNNNKLDSAKLRFYPCFLSVPSILLFFFTSQFKINDGSHLSTNLIKLFNIEQRNEGEAKKKKNDTIFNTDLFTRLDPKIKCCKKLH